MHKDSEEPILLRGSVPDLGPRPAIDVDLCDTAALLGEDAYTVLLDDLAECAESHGKPLPKIVVE